MIPGFPPGAAEQMAAALQQAQTLQMMGAAVGTGGTGAGSAGSLTVPGMALPGQPAVLGLPGLMGLPGAAGQMAALQQMAAMQQALAGKGAGKGPGVANDRGGRGEASGPGAGSSSAPTGHDGTREGAAKDFMRRNRLPSDFSEKLMRHLERKLDNWQEELDRLDKELKSAEIPILLRPQFLLVTFGDVVPQTWTDYDEEPRKGSAPDGSYSYGHGTRGNRSPSPAAAPSKSRRSRSRDRRRDRSRDRDRSRSRPRRSRSRSRRRDRDR
mmetsp:Transcript_40959/g.73648  ORF Transcript_40959/g.73648 Transcript_40959/m.73648 type:complete len:269 (+) Transcript_40959:114-920(+)